MTVTDIVVIILGLYFGFIFVTLYLNKKESEVPKPNKSNMGNNQSNSQAYQESESENWYQVLEVNKSASMFEIENNYKRKISQYHPDKVASLGKELQELAEIKSKEINLAYEYAKQLKIHP